MIKRLRDAWAVLNGTASLRAVATAEKPRTPVAEEPTRGITEAALAEATASYGAPLNPWTLPELPDFMPPAAAPKMAMDGVPAAFSPSAIYQWAAGSPFTEGLAWLGFPYLAELSQRPEYRRVSEIYAQEATRKWIKFNGDKDKIQKLESAITKFDIRAKIKRVVELDGFFGRAQIFIDLGDHPNDDELAKPLVASAKIKAGSIKNFTVVEPFWSYPGPYEATNPLDPDFYVPQIWYVMAARVHVSRLLTVISRELPDMLKPAYAFSGLSLSQGIKPYVDNFIRTRQSVSDLIHSFSTMVLKTDMSQILTGGAADKLSRRLMLAAKLRDNKGWFAINKDSEEIENISTPLGTLDDLQNQSLEMIPMAAQIPVVLWKGDQSGGLNASSEGEIKTWYANVKAYQEKAVRSPLSTIIDLIQLEEFGAIDPDIKWEFVDLWEMSAADKAAIRKSDADIDQIYIASGVASNEEVRDRITTDEDSPYYGMELVGDDDAGEDDPNNPDGGGGGDPSETEDLDDTLDKPRGALDAQWEEGKHKRRDDGKFGSGGGGASAGGGGGKGTPSPSPSPTPSPAPSVPQRPVAANVREILGDQGIDKLRELIANPQSKARDVLAALAPLDHASKERTPTLSHGTMPDAAFWGSRTYEVDGKPATIQQAGDHLQAVAKHYAGANGVKRERKARILLGPPAAGKSTSAEQIARQGGYAIVDGDDAKKVIPEFDHGMGASAVHEESSFMSEAVLAKMIGEGDNVILPLVGGKPGSIEKRIALLKSQGYHVTVDLVDVNEDEAARRMVSRALRTGRHISSSYFASIGTGPRDTYEHLKSKYRDLGFGRIDGNGPPKAERYAEAINHPEAEPGRSLFGGD